MPFASICSWSCRHHFSWAGWLRISRSLCTPLHLADATFIQKHAGQSTASRSEGSRAATAGNGARLAVSYIKTCLQRFGPVKSSYGRYGGHGCCAQWVLIGWWLGSITWPVCLVDAKGLKGSPWVTFAPCQKQALTFARQNIRRTWLLFIRSSIQEEPAAQVKRHHDVLLYHYDPFLDFQTPPQWIIWTQLLAPNGKPPRHHGTRRVVGHRWSSKIVFKGFWTQQRGAVNGVIPWSAPHFHMFWLMT